MVMRILSALFDLILPPVCYVCRQSCSGKYGLCERCAGKIRHIHPPQYAKMNYIEKGWSCCYYENTVKECIHLFKYRKHIGLIDIFGDIMEKFARENGIAKDADLIVPVPVHPAKKRERSYNHAEVLARRLAKTFDISSDFKNLKKLKWTRAQSELDREKRLTNVRDSFIALDRSVFRGKNVLLVDDVYTTGATVNECAKTLLNAEAKKVSALTLARTHNHSRAK